ncbi:MAG: hypothetical protein ABJH75_10495, partial [Roseibium sp.]|uniref:hypothetical protein n=1 Tax=Roseibium sp. TaxID=1936156 RepID=UPI0032998203
AGLQDLFEKNGIKFAHRQVTVRVANPNDGPEDQAPPTTNAAAAAAAGAAAARMLDDEEGAQAGEASADQL